METRALVPIATPNLTTGQPPATPARLSSEVAPPPQAQIEAAEDFRLIIERDESSGSYVYTTIDRRTGEVIQRLPREEVLRMGEDDHYANGQVISATA